MYDNFKELTTKIKSKQEILIIFLYFNRKKNGVL